jgi:glycine/D-amino acid oxidase-like deaminating enzyme/nitrite reductase/ring-hydroxylating ferredoxin subunit
MTQLTQSLWMEEKLPVFQRLEKDLQVDTCIIGAGLAGLTCAYELAKKGKSVAILEKSSLASGETLRTTAHLTWALDARYHKLIKIYGKNSAKLIAESHTKAIDYTEKVVSDEKIDCDFERLDGYLLADQTDILDKELAALKKINISLKKTPYGLRFPEQAQFHISKYLKGLIIAIIKYGGQIYTQTHAVQFKGGNPCVVRTEKQNQIIAKNIIMATCTPINSRFFIHTKQAPYRTYVIAATIPKNTTPHALYWDTENPYHYVRLQHNPHSNFDWLIVGGEDHKTGQEKENVVLFSLLEAWAKQRFQEMGEIKYRWSGQVFEPVDSLAFIGRESHDSHVYIVTGHSGNGMTYAAIAAILLSDLIFEKENPWEKLYCPSRKTLSTAARFLEENSNVAIQYMDWFTPGEMENIEKLPKQEGAILREGLHKIAVYKDENNQIQAHSAFCPHLGGCVRWNKVEKTWDCPCHGSRFDTFGNVVCGPAKTGLKPYKL